jgi:flagellar biosynthesis protein FlhF
MKIRKFQGSSSREALKKAALMFGEDIVLIETKLVREKSLGQSPVYEVLIGVNEEQNSGQISEEKGDFDLKIDTFESSAEIAEMGKKLSEQRPEKRREAPQQQQVKRSTPYTSSAQSLSNTQQATPQKKKEEIFLDVSETARKISELAQKKQMESMQKTQKKQDAIDETKDQFKSIETKESKIVKTASANGENSELFKEIKSEISQLNDKIKLIQNMFWNEKSPTDIATTIPPEFSEIYRIAKQSGMKREHLDMLMKLSIQHMPFKMRHNSETVKRYFKVVLRKMIPTRAETLVQSPNQKIIMLVGPTGVGKTTTIAKLTARFSLKSERNYKVGLIVLDSYKIGAVEQLSQYARMMRVNIEAVVSPDEFMEKLERMSTFDYIFVDTMGSSPYDISKIEHIETFLRSNHLQQNIDVMLVVPSSLKYEDLKHTYDSFSKLNIDTIMFTKLDETKGFGNIFSLVHDIQKPISYFSIGQEVPEDIIVATSDYLVDSLLNGFKRERDE